MPLILKRDLKLLGGFIGNGEPPCVRAWVSDRMVGWLRGDWKGQRHAGEWLQQQRLASAERRRPVGREAPACPVSPSGPQWYNSSELPALGQGSFASSQLR